MIRPTILAGSLCLGTLALTPLAPPAYAQTSAASPSPPSWTTRIAKPEPQPGPPLTGWVTTIVRLRPARSSEITLARVIPPQKPASATTHDLQGAASFYWQFETTASGERYDPKSLTAAHRTLPFGTRVRVTNVANGRTVLVRINNRGPFKPGRVIDLSEAAADAIDMRSRGIVPVKLEVVEP
ncbi:MAG: septal ring lytic transglycosylase RlpA family protein [Hyphomicrobiaceae bacterium]